jgi:hypothetical protein
VIELSRSKDHVFVYVPPGLDQPYLEQALSRSLSRDVSISSCKTTNLCASAWGGVSNSGATVLRLSLDLGHIGPFDVVAKILSPDPVNLFKGDYLFDSRISEVAWAQWWGQQGVPFVAKVYGTRADPSTRTFWILQEYFAQVGWPDVPVEGMKPFITDLPRLQRLFAQVAVVHAYSRGQIDELSSLFSGRGTRPGYLCTPSDLLDALAGLLLDARFLEQVGVTGDECRLLESYCAAVEERPAWVDEWDVVCVTADWAPDNFGIRDGDQTQVPVTFDWGTTRLAPMEEDLCVLLSRLRELEEDVRESLVRHYLQVYADRTGRQIDYQAFMARLPWANFLVHLRGTAGHANILRWVPYQSRSREFLHLFIGLCDSLLERCQRA